MLKHLVLPYGLFISNKDFTGLVTMETVTKETRYFPSPIAILAVYCMLYVFLANRILTDINRVYISR